MSKIFASQKVQCPDLYIYQNSLHVYDFRQIRKIPLFSFRLKGPTLVLLL